MASETLSRVSTTLPIRHDYTIKPYGLHWRSHTLFIVSTVGIGLFSDLFLYGLIVPLLPHILTDRVHLPKDQIQSHVDLLLTCYAASSVVVAPISGYIADRTASRQAPFLAGLTALLIATVMLFTVNTVPLLVIARLGQGASSAFVWTVGLTLCIDTVGPENLGTVLGSIFSFVTVGAIFAPVVGGALYAKAGYAAVGFTAMGVLIVDFVMRVLVIEKKVAARYDIHDPEISGQTDVSNDADSNEHARIGDGDEERPQTELSPLLSNGKNENDTFAVPPESELAWIFRKAPILYPLTHSPSLIIAFLTAGVQAMLIGSFDATVPTHAGELFGFDSLKTGLLFIPLGITSIVIGPLAGWAVDRYGVKLLAVTGFALLVPFLTLLRLPQPDPLVGQSIFYGALLGLCGIGLAVIDAPSIVESGTVIDRYHKRNPGFFGEQGPYAQLYGYNGMIFSAGLAIGPVLAGSLKESIGYGNMAAVLAAVAGVSSVLCFLYLGGKPKLLGNL